MLLTRHYDQRPFEKLCAMNNRKRWCMKTVKKGENVCDGGCIKHDSDFYCVCDIGHTVQLN